jgi:predicted dehydrogenase
MRQQRDLTRRDFLKTAAAVAAVSAAPGLRARALHASPAAGQAVRYGMIGVGTHGSTLLRHLTTIPEGRCVALCDIYPPNLRKAVETAGTNPTVFEDYRRLLELPGLDAVIIATPLYLHSRMVLDSLSAGKHVFVEKSMFFKEEEGAEIRKAAEARPKQVLQVGLQRRSSVLYQVAMEMIRKGALGKVMFVRAQWHRNNNWRRPVADPRYERLINWRMYREYSGGLMAELGSHQIDVANWALDAEPDSVIATGGIDYWKDGRETWDNVQAVFEYPEGRKLLYSSILFNQRYEFNEQIMGDQGTIEITLGNGMYFREPIAKVESGPAKENWWAGATVAERSAQKGIPIFPETSDVPEGFVARELRFAKRWLASMGIYQFDEPQDPVRAELENFFASIREGKPVVAGLEVGVADSLAVIYANRSIDSGQKVFWPHRAS